VRTATSRRAWVDQIMGLPISVHLRGANLDGSATTKAVARVFADLRRVDELFSTYRADSQITRFNRGELAINDLDPMVRAVISLCEQARVRTDGYFDAYLPAPGGGRHFDPSGLVKGWAAERASLYLRRLSTVSFYLNAGGDIIVGGPGGGDPWRVGVEDPTDATKLVDVIAVASGAVATSGVAHRGLHIMDPHSGVPALEIQSATVVGESLTWADVYATAAVACGRDAATRMAQVAGYEALLVCTDGRLLATPGWPSAQRRPIDRPA
jgi:thiamine biosynthesis lipoprotein